MTRTRWPLLVIGASAATATWSGWVGLGGLTGFGVMNPLPGIWDGLQINTAITLPIGVEAYATYALATATSSGPLTVRARRFAWWSAAAALILGMAGQAVYHVMTAAGVKDAPPLVTIGVSCLPVMVIGAAALLWHWAAEAVVSVTDATQETRGAVEPEAPTTVEPVQPAAAEVATDIPATEPVPEPLRLARPIPADRAVRETVARMLAGETPSLRSVKARYHVAHGRATTILSEARAHVDRADSDDDEESNREATQ